MYYYLDIKNPLDATSHRHILTRLPDGGVQSWHLTEDNPNKPAYDAWLAEGNTPEPWDGPDANN